MNHIKTISMPPAVDDRDQCDIPPETFLAEQIQRSTYIASVNAVSSIIEAVSIFTFNKVFSSRRLNFSGHLTRSDKRKIKRTVNAYEYIATNVALRETKV